MVSIANVTMIWKYIIIFVVRKKLGVVGRETRKTDTLFNECLLFLSFMQGSGNLLTLENMNKVTSVRQASIFEVWSKRFSEISWRTHPLCWSSILFNKIQKFCNCWKVKQASCFFSMDALKPSTKLTKKFRKISAGNERNSTKWDVYCTLRCVFKNFIHSLVFTYFINWIYSSELPYKRLAKLYNDLEVDLRSTECNLTLPISLFDSIINLLNTKHKYSNCYLNSLNA